MITAGPPSIPARVQGTRVDRARIAGSYYSALRVSPCPAQPTPCMRRAERLARRAQCPPADPNSDGRLPRVEITAWRSERDPKAKGPFPVSARKKSEKITRIFSGFFYLRFTRCFSVNPLQSRLKFRRDFFVPFNPGLFSGLYSCFYPELFPGVFRLISRWQYPEFLQTCLKPVQTRFPWKSYTNTSGRNKRDRRDDMRPYIYPSAVRYSHRLHIHAVPRPSAIFYMLY